MNIEDKLFALGAGFMMAIVFSWIPWLAYNLVASVFTILPALEWSQITFFTWVGLTVFFWYID